MDPHSEKSREITKMLREWGDGRREALDELMPLVYDELRRQASRYLRGERRGHTLQTTALIHEAYLKLVDQRQVDWQNRAHFFGIAAQAMKRILVDHAKSRHREKRGGAASDLPLDEARSIMSGQKGVDLVAVDEALTRLAEFDPQQASIVELKFFGGFSIEEISEAAKISPATVKREWNSAKAWLKLEMTKH
ncbi:MAG TPA: sigma-70 family RNA polymerase sigma factor [Pyrinomonadaceae bacterium]|nr:sigma-70 family RNA polymerase sigma factor [Pyrinomonadaceae bacterium]